MSYCRIFQRPSSRCIAKTKLVEIIHLDFFCQASQRQINIYDFVREQKEYRFIEGDFINTLNHISVIYNEIKNQLFVFGGQSMDNYSSDIFTISLDTMESTKLEVASIIHPEGRREASICFKYPYLFCFGGCRIFKTFNDLWAYNVETNKWQQILIQNPSQIPKMSNSSSYFIDNKLYIVGGIIQNCFENKQQPQSNNIQVIDLQKYIKEGKNNYLKWEQSIEFPDGKNVSPYNSSSVYQDIIFILNIFPQFQFYEIIQYNTKDQTLHFMKYDFEQKQEQQYQIFLIQNCLIESTMDKNSNKKNVYDLNNIYLNNLSLYEMPITPIKKYKERYSQIKYFFSEKYYQEFSKLRQRGNRKNYFSKYYNQQCLNENPIYILLTSIKFYPKKQYFQLPESSFQRYLDLTQKSSNEAILLGPQNQSQLFFSKKNLIILSSYFRQFFSIKQNSSLKSLYDCKYITELDEAEIKILFGYIHTQKLVFPKSTSIQSIQKLLLFSQYYLFSELEYLCQQALLLKSKQNKELLNLCSFTKQNQMHQFMSQVCYKFLMSKGFDHKIYNALKEKDLIENILHVFRQNELYFSLYDQNLQEFVTFLNTSIQLK